MQQHRVRFSVGIFVVIMTLVACMTSAFATTSTLTSPYTDITYTVDCDAGDIVYGIDVSYYQGTIDWEAVAEDGIEFVFIRAAVRYSGTGTLSEDNRFYENIQGALSAGLKVGVYVFSQAITAEEAREEAAFLIDLVSAYDIDLPLVFDPEFLSYSDASKGHYGRLYTAYSALSTTAEKISFLTELAEAFYDEVTEAGYVPMYYGSFYWLRDSVDTSIYDGSIWLARYNTQTNYTSDYAFWQYSSTGSVSGITGNVDCNFCLNTVYLDCRSLATSQQTVTSSITITPTKYPTGTIQAASFSLAGTITSNLSLSSVTGSICTTTGTVVQTVTVSTSGKTYSIAGSTIDSGLKFASLSDGTYVLTYSATDCKGYTTTWTSDAFTVGNSSSGTSVITISPTSYPSGNITAKSFTLKGTVTCTTTLSTVTGRILTADGTQVQSATVTGVNSTSFTIQNSTIDNNLRFAGLEAGYYRLEYTATAADGSTATWISDVFAVADCTLFTDVTNSSAWYYDAVYTSASLGIFYGYTDGSFKPTKNITRIEVICLLYRMAGSPQVTGDHPFEDATASWYQDALIWAYQQGVTAGTSSTTFSPGTAITRQEFATMLYRFYQGTAPADDCLSGYTDQSKVASWARDAMNWCVYMGIIHGTGSTTLSPKSNTTRAQAAQMITNIALSDSIVLTASSAALQAEVPEDAEAEDITLAELTAQEETEEAEEAEEADTTPAEAEAVDRIEGEDTAQPTDTEEIIPEQDTAEESDTPVTEGE